MTLTTALVTATGCDPSAPTGPPIVDLHSCKDLSFGDRGDCVKELQRLLNERGAQLEVEGYFGPDTRAVVHQFQRARGLPETDIVDDDTRKELSIRPLFGDWNLSTECVDLQRGAEGECVESLQNLLRLYGADLSDDATYGPITTGAVHEFQRNHGLKVDGIVGPWTKEALYTELPPTLPFNPDLEVQDCTDTQCSVYLDRNTTASVANAFDTPIIKDLVTVFIIELACSRLRKAKGLTVFCATIIQSAIDIITQFRQAQKNQRCVQISFQSTSDGTFKPVEFSQTGGENCQS